MTGLTRVLALSVTSLALLSPALTAAEVTVYAGSYTNDGKSPGITRFQLDTETGAMTAPETAAVSDSPSFLCLSRNGRNLYAVNESTSTVSAWKRNPETGALTDLAQQPVADGERVGPCHLALGPEEKSLVVANYGGGSVAAFPLDEDGMPKERSTFIQHTGTGPDASRQEKPHAHGVTLSPDGRYVLVPDLGADRIFLYTLDPATSVLQPAPQPEAALPPASGPRHGVFHPKLPLFFCINELSSTIVTFRWNAEKATLTASGDPVSTLPADFTGKSGTAEIAVHPNGKFVYGSNRGHDSIAVFRISDTEKGTLTPVQHMTAGIATPRNFILDPTGRWLLAANQASGTVCVFAVDPDKGTLSETPHKIEIGSPVCLVIAPGSR